jgi:hypothetical protein
LMTARVLMLLKSQASLTCFRACFLPGRAKDLSAPWYVEFLQDVSEEGITVSICIFAHVGHRTNSPNSIHLQIQESSYMILTSSPYCLGFIHLQKFLGDRTKIWSYIIAPGTGIGMFFSRGMAGYLARHARSSHYETCMPNT